MSDAAERPAAEPDADAWAAAVEEDLAAEQARRRAEHGPQQLSAAEELRKLADAVSSRVAELGRPLGGAAGQFAVQGVAQQFLAQARAVVEPVVERNPQVFDHLATAGSELLAAYRSAVQGQERRWAATLRPEDAVREEGVPEDAVRDEPDHPGGRTGRTDGAGRGTDAGDGRGDDDPGPGPERIDLD
ncbi:DUF5304 domain-containing protein [Streptomyces sp. JJ36]|uniref:DUF5304 domain-containing protein n=1 Tax=Streptomyces sp. JJ36 TaxID=2736645 RepID=UPI001F17595E|nr:DUF5304 domain-containing protein [Streptomyces sp. JJ36]MCF6522990.1 DUF5304 domain-containing protein [Streptomyces sp. JJ36]